MRRRASAHTGIARFAFDSHSRAGYQPYEERVTPYSGSAMALSLLHRYGTRWAGSGRERRQGIEGHYRELSPARAIQTLERTVVTDCECAALRAGWCRAIMAEAAAPTLPSLRSKPGKLIRKTQSKQPRAEQEQ